MIKNIFKIALGLVVVSSTLLSYEIKMESIGFAGGNAKTPLVQHNKDNKEIVIDKLDDNFKTMELYTVLKPIEEIGMNPYLSYTYSYNEQFINYYVMAGLNKYYKISSSSKLYLGVLGGYGQMKWEFDPINGSDNDVSTQSYILGVQGGVSIPLENLPSDKLSLDINVKYLSHEYITNLKTSATTSQIEHYETMLAQVGISYRF